VAGRAVTVVAEVPSQEPLFDASRYSAVSVGVMLKLPESNARSFMVAAALGRFLRLDGSSDRVRGGKDVGGTLVTGRHRPAILEALGIDARRWRRLTEDWEARYVAHRCGKHGRGPRGAVFLFAQWLYAKCPACHVPLYVNGLPPAAQRARGLGFKAGQIDPPSGSDRPP
jgi:hypothetical protein